MEFERKRFGAVCLEPVLVGEALAYLGDGLTDGALGVSQVWVLRLEELCCSSSGLSSP